MKRSEMKIVQEWSLNFRVGQQQKNIYVLVEQVGIMFGIEITTRTRRLARLICPSKHAALAFAEEISDKLKSLDYYTAKETIDYAFSFAGYVLIRFCLLTRFIKYRRQQLGEILYQFRLQTTVDTYGFMHASPHFSEDVYFFHSKYEVPLGQFICLSKSEEPYYSIEINPLLAKA